MVFWYSIIALAKLSYLLINQNRYNDLAMCFKQPPSYFQKNKDKQMTDFFIKEYPPPPLLNAMLDIMFKRIKSGMY